MGKTEVDGEGPATGYQGHKKKREDDDRGAREDGSSNDNSWSQPKNEDWLWQRGLMSCRVGGLSRTVQSPAGCKARQGKDPIQRSFSLSREFFLCWRRQAPNRQSQWDPCLHPCAPGGQRPTKSFCWAVELSGPTTAEKGMVRTRRPPNVCACTVYRVHLLGIIKIEFVFFLLSSQAPSSPGQMNTTF